MEPDVRSFLYELEDKNLVKHVSREFSPRYEIAAILKHYDLEFTVIFEKISNFNGKIVGNLCNTREKLSIALNASKSRLHEHLLYALKNPRKPTMKDDAAFLDFSSPPNLSQIPILTYYEKDAGPYITSGVVISRDPDLGFQNMSIHRLLVVDKDTLAIRVVPRHLHHFIKKAEKRNQPLPVCIAIGLHPAILLAAASSPPLGVDELHIANTLLKDKLSVFKCEGTGLIVPANAEYLLEGFLYPTCKVDEGPFVDATGTYDAVRKQPIIKLTGIFHRERPIYQALLPGGSEHRLLMGFHREAAIKEAVSRVVPEVKSVRLTFGGCGWLHAVISIRKVSDGDGKNAILAAFAAHPSLKHVVVVDEDVDVDDLNEVEWALATRFQAEEDLIVIRNARGSSIDPSADQEALITSKMGLDATRPLNKPTQHFMKGKIPISDKVKKFLLGE